MHTIVPGNLQKTNYTCFVFYNWAKKYENTFFLITAQLKP